MALLHQGSVLRALGQRERSQAVITKARSIIGSCPDPGDLDRAAGCVRAVPAGGHRLRGRAADAEGAQGAPAADQRSVRARHRPRTVCVAQHRSQPRQVDLPQTRRLLAGPRPPADPRAQAPLAAMPRYPRARQRAHLGGDPRERGRRWRRQAPEPGISWPSARASPRWNRPAGDDRLPARVRACTCVHVMVDGIASRQRRQPCQSLPLAPTPILCWRCSGRSSRSFLFVIWFWILIWVFIDIFRSPDLSGLAKALWFLFVLFIPLVGVLVYLIARGGSMHERAGR